MTPTPMESIGFMQTSMLIKSDGTIYTTYGLVVILPNGTAGREISNKSWTVSGEAAKTIREAVGSDDKPALGTVNEKLVDYLRTMPDWFESSGTQVASVTQPAPTPVA